MKQWQVTRGKWQDQMAEVRQNAAHAKGIKSYKDLLVWQKGITLVKEIYRLTQAFPDAEKFGLVSQMRRAAVSVPSNIAEGECRRTRREFIQLLSLRGFRCGIGNPTRPQRRVRLLHGSGQPASHESCHGVEQNA